MLEQPEHHTIDAFSFFIYIILNEKKEEEKKLTLVDFQMLYLYHKRQIGC